MNEARISHLSAKNVEAEMLQRQGSPENPGSLIIFVPAFFKDQKAGHPRYSESWESPCRSHTPTAAYRSAGPATGAVPHATASAGRAD
jgi:hypothetical protein